MSERFEEQRGQFLKALERLREAMAENETDLIRDAMIQRFEFTFEMAWRTLFRLLTDRGERVAQQSSAVLAAAFTGLLLDDPALWDRIRIARNQTSHTYDEDKAVEVAAMIRADALSAFDALAAKLAAI
ncbi:MAG: nucleotidyltransferase substrate binding protein [Pseudomonadota bacterium]|nr:nucleotidyltransferase substrate binding protein [Pseudomonadota bacterium]